jgi:hypothetical protein
MDQPKKGCKESYYKPGKDLLHEIAIHLVNLTFVTQPPISLTRVGIMWRI